MLSEAPVVLFVDPDLTETRPLRSELRRRGARVLQAASIRQALGLIQEAKPDVLVLDEDLSDPDIPDPPTWFREALPSAEMALLRSRPSDTPRGWGLGLIYSGTKRGAGDMLLEAILQAFPRRLSQAEPRTLAPALVLCVDDDRQCLASVSRLLTRHGYRVVTHDDPKTALGAMKESVPDLALLDVMMPGMDGFEMTREIRREFAGLVPVVLLTAKQSEQDRAAGRENGASYLVAKPCDPSRLLDVVDYYAGDLDAQERELLEARL
jgi:DNA-binding response OmpR family regulator